MELLLPIALVAVGLILIGIEVYLVPGINVVGIIGFLCLLFAVGYGFSSNGWIGGTLILLGTVLLGGGLGYLMWRSGAWENFVLATSVPPDHQLAETVQENRARYLGRSGRALTPLRPTGVAEIEGDRVEVVTEGAFIAAGSEVRVVAMDRRRVFVRLADTDPAALPPSSA